MARTARGLACVAALCSTALFAVQSGSPELRLTLTEGTSMAAAASPDGRTVVIDLLGALWTVPIDGGRARRILEDGYDARLPAWSPDGKRIAFQAYRDSTWNIWTIDAEGSGLRRETSGPFDDREPHWSPDGTRLAFSSDRSGSYDVWLLEGACRLQQGKVEARGEHAVLWIDRTHAAQQVPTKAICYLEGNVQIDFGHDRDVHRATGRAARASRRSGCALTRSPAALRPIARRRSRRDSP